MALLAACGGGSSDRERYRRALTGPPEQAAELCATVEDPLLAGECGAGVAVRLAATGAAAAALEACGRLEARVWAEECVFEVVDTLGWVGPTAWDACGAAGRFRDYCVGHAVNRSLAELPADRLPLEIGAEDRLVIRLRVQVRKLGVDLPKAHLETVQFTAAARRIAARWQHRPFDPTECGVATARLCGRAYAETMPRGTVDRARVCAGPLTSEAVAAAGGTPWVGGADEVVAPVWAALCVGDGQRAGSSTDAPGPRPPQDRPAPGGGR